MALYQTVTNRVAMLLLLEGSTTGAEVQLAAGGSWATHGTRTLKSLSKHGLVERVYTGERRHPNEARYILTAAGRAVASEWGLVMGRRGECCEAAILGIEGDHDPYPVCERGRHQALA